MQAINSGRLRYDVGAFELQISAGTLVNLYRRTAQPGDLSGRDFGHVAGHAWREWVSLGEGMVLRELAAVLAMGQTQVDGIRLRERYRELPTPGKGSALVLRTSAGDPQRTNRFRLELDGGARPPGSTNRRQEVAVPAALRRTLEGDGTLVLNVALACAWSARLRLTNALCSDLLSIWGFSRAIASDHGVRPLDRLRSRTACCEFWYAGETERPMIHSVA